MKTENAAVGKIIEVVIVDDHAIACQGIKFILSRDPAIKVIAEASDVYDAIVLVATQRPDVAILDMRLKNGTGIDVIKALKKLASSTKILVLSAYDQAQYVKSVKKLGVDGFLSKTVSAGELRKTIHSICDENTKVYKNRVDGSRRSKLEKVSDEKVLARSNPLTIRELQVLQLIGEGLKNRQIAQQMGIAPKTVETHVEHVLLKLRAKNRTEAALKMVGAGRAFVSSL